MKTMCPPGYHHNGFVATHALGYMMFGHMINRKLFDKGYMIKVYKNLFLVNVSYHHNFFG